MTKHQHDVIFHQKIIWLVTTVGPLEYPDDMAVGFPQRESSNREQGHHTTFYDLNSHAALLCLCLLFPIHQKHITKPNPLFQHPCPISRNIQLTLLHHCCIQNSPCFSFTVPINVFSIDCQVKVKVAQLCPTLCNSMDCVHGILQARILEWVAFPFSRRSSQQTISSCIICPLPTSLPHSLSLCPLICPPYYSLKAFAPTVPSTPKTLFSKILI